VQLTYRLLKKVDGYVDELQEAAEKLFDHNISYIELSPEFGDIAVKINHLKQESEKNARLAKESEQKKNDLVMYLAHDLKTPLSSVIGYLILLREEKQISEEMREKYLSISLEKAEQLENLINEFFEITRFNLSNITLQYSRINLMRLLEQLIYEFQPMMKEKNLQCNLTVPSDVMLRCDANKMQRVFENILRNAVIYSYSDTEITVRADVKEESIELCFENRGNTIPFEILEHIFEQFYRLDFSRRTNSGSGLGLAIAKQIVELHGGTITAQSKDENIRFRIALPAS
jgi:two-component system sensor histidine kinase VanS